VECDSRGDQVKVVIELREPDMGVTGERVWAAPLGSDLYEIRNSPWHSRKVNWGDIVKARPRSDGQWPIFIEVVRRSGHRTVHIYLLEKGREKQEEFLAKFKELGATYENADSKMYALDFEPGVDVQPTLAYLELLKTKGLLDYRINENW
jgi:uncharacterized protein DUF4265